MKKINLSIDFDFFCREEPSWDWGHAETTFMENMMWHARYVSNMNIEEEITTGHADFNPVLIGYELRMKGIDIRPATRLCIADSHYKAYEFFDDGNPHLPMVSIDAHHDLYTCPLEESVVRCDNWLAMFIDKAESTHVLYPKWRDPDHDGSVHESFDNNERVNMMQFCDFDAISDMGDVLEVESLFLCKSPAWTPPHMDRYYTQIAKRLLTLGRLEVTDVELSLPRTYPSREEVDTYRERITTVYHKAAE